MTIFVYWFESFLQQTNLHKIIETSKIKINPPTTQQIIIISTLERFYNIFRSSLFYIGAGIFEMLNEKYPKSDCKVEFTMPRTVK
jgi:hypothetical protein